MALDEHVARRLADIVGAAHVRTDADSLQTWGRDWTRAYQPAPAAVVFPARVEELRDIVLLANQARLALVPSGGRTGLSAGAVAAHGEIVVSLDRMNQMLEFMPQDRMVRVQAGVVTAQLQSFAREHDLYYPVDFASAGSSQIGGNVSTNAGGIKVIRYGLTRHWVMGLKVVTGRGDILDLNKDMTKNATGYDLRHLFIGAEGTLGFVAEATMKLERPPQDLRVMVLGVPHFEAVMQVLETFRQRVDLCAFEYFSDLALQLVTAHQGLPRPFAAATPLYVLLEFEGSSEAVVDEAMQAFEHCVAHGWLIDGVMSHSDEQARRLWRLREGISETIARYTPYKNDLSVTLGRMAAFIRDIEAVVARRYPAFRVVWYGHVGDGNLHLNILKPEALPPEEFFARCQEVNSDIFDIVARHRGSISAEHGVGLLKKTYLEYTRAPQELAYLRAIKQIFDPNGVMNPGKLLDLDGTA